MPALAAAREPPTEYDAGLARLPDPPDARTYVTEPVDWPTEVMVCVCVRSSPLLRAVPLEADVPAAALYPATSVRPAAAEYEVQFAGHVLWLLKYAAAPAGRVGTFAVLSTSSQSISWVKARPEVVEVTVADGV